MKSVPPLNLKAEYAEIKTALEKRVKGVFTSGRYILGPEVDEFEKSFAKFIGTKYAIGVASGTDAVLLPLMAQGLKEGDEIITTPFTFIASATSIVRVGAKPVFVDIEPDTYNMDPELIEAKITSKTKGIVVVHLYGNPCRMDKIKAIAKRHNLFIVEDCAQACGAAFGGKRVGSFGEAGAFSFYPTKTLGAIGDGGIITTNDPEIYETIKSLRHHGDDGKHSAYNHIRIGINSRLDELQAAILNVKLKFLPKWNRQRKAHAAYYGTLIKKSKIGLVDLPKDTPAGQAVYHQYILRIKKGKRDSLLAHLRANGIQSAVYYPTPLHLQPCFAYLGYQKGDFPVSEKASKEVLSLPIYPQLTKFEQQHVVNSLSSF